jgi:hypothetical protein
VMRMLEQAVKQQIGRALLHRHNRVLRAASHVEEARLSPSYWGAGISPEGDLTVQGVALPQVARVRNPAACGRCRADPRQLPRLPDRLLGRACTGPSGHLLRDQRTGQGPAHGPRDRPGGPRSERGFGIPATRTLTEWDQRLQYAGLPVWVAIPGQAPTPADYAAQIVPLLNAYLAEGGDTSTEVVFEPGRAITGSAEMLLLTVLRVKEVGRSTSIGLLRSLWRSDTYLVWRATIPDR